MSTQSRALPIQKLSSECPELSHGDSELSSEYPELSSVDCELGSDYPELSHDDSELSAAEILERRKGYERPRLKVEPHGAITPEVWDTKEPGPRRPRGLGRSLPVSN